MSRTLVKAKTKLEFKPPKELASLFADAPLVGNERREDYEKLVAALVRDAKPSDAIAWLYLGDVANLTWEILRARWLKLRVINSAEYDRVVMLVRSDDDPERKEQLQIAAEWARFPDERPHHNKELIEKGFCVKPIIENALWDSAVQVDMIDKRIASYEARRNVALRELDRHDESVARRLNKASLDIIDGEFTEAAE